MEERVYEISKEEKGKLEAILKSDPYEEVSFSRVDTKIKEEEGKVYLYVKADESFFDYCDKKLGELNSVKRCEKEKEEEIIKKIKEEEETAAGGFGSVFG
mgnify:CR=1 FL=1